MTPAELRELLSRNPDLTLVTDGHYTTLEPAPIVERSMQRRVLEDRFAALWRDLNGPPLAREVRFHPKRRWRFDFADTERKIAYEIQGGLYQAQSGHRSHDGVRRDAEKLNAAQLLGWRVFQITTYTLRDTEWLAELAQWHRAQLPKDAAQ